MSFSLPTTVTKPARELIPAKTHIARIYQIVELGHIASDKFTAKDGTPKVDHRILISFEFPGLMRTFDEKKGPEPMVRSVSLSLTFGEKSKLLPIVKNLLGKSPANGDTIDIGELLGKPAMIAITHEMKDGEMRDKIDGIMAPIDGIAPPAPVIPPVGFSFANWDDKVFATLPEFVREDIQSSQEYKAKFGGAVANAAANVAAFNAAPATE